MWKAGELVSEKIMEAKNTNLDKGQLGLSFVNKKKQKELDIVQKMIEIYCKENHQSNEKLCEECQEMLDYAKQRIERCPFTETKTFCASCKVHCYRADMKAKIKEVMKFSGPRLIFFYPGEVFLHAIDTIRYKLLDNTKSKIKKK